jgi:hypothetical protein
MQDLTFAADPDGLPRDYRLVVSRRGRPNLAVLSGLAGGSLPFLKPGSSELAAARLRPAAVIPLGREERRGLSALQVDLLVLAYLVVAALTVAWAWRQQRDSAIDLIVLFVFFLFFLPFVTVTANIFLDHTPERAMRTAQHLLLSVERAAEAFRDDTGCFPASVADLASRTAPVLGVDASGNPVPVRGWRGPYLDQLPPPLLAEPGVVLDPLNTRLADLAGLQTTVRPTNRPRTHTPPK